MLDGDSDGKSGVKCPNSEQVPLSKMLMRQRDAISAG